MYKFHPGREGDGPWIWRIHSSGYLKGISAVNAKSREEPPLSTDLYVMRGPLKKSSPGSLLFRRRRCDSDMKGHV